MPDSASIEGIEKFDADLNRASKALGLSMGAIVQKVIFDLLRATVMHTPVAEGTLAGNWQVNEGPAPTADPREFKGSREAALAFDLASVVSTRFDDPFGLWWLANPMPYAPVVEFGLFGDGPGTSGGYSIKSPAGMLRISLAEVEAELEEHVRAALRENGL